MIIRNQHLHPIFRHHIFALLTVLFITLPHIQANEINFDHIGASQGLSQVSVMSVYQDETGYMWFGTRGGLNRYDGQNIEVFHFEENNPNSLPSSIINDICGDRKGSLYLLCGYKYLTVYHFKSNTFSTIHKSCQAVTAGKNHIWYAAGNTIYSYNTKGESRKHFRIPASLTVTKIFEDSRNNLFIGTDKGLFVYEKSGKLRVVLSTGLINSIFEDSKHKLWVGTETKGLFCIRPDGKTDIFSQHSANHGISSNIVRDVCEDDDGLIWIGTFNGLNRLNPETGAITFFSGENPKPGTLSHSSIYSVFKDKQGTIWVGSYYGGVNSFHPESNIYSYYYPDKNSDETVNFPVIGKMTEDNHKNLWICTEGGGLNLYNRKTGKFRYYKANIPNSISHNNLKCIWFDKNAEKLYIGTHTAGLDILNLKTGLFQNINTKNNPNLKNNVIVSLLSYRDQLLIATQGGCVSLNTQTQEISPFEVIHNGVDIISRSTAMCLDSKQNLWFNSDSGLVKHNPKKKQTVIYQHTFDKNQIKGRLNAISIFEDRRGRIFAGTYGSGLMEYIPEKEEFRRYTKQKNGLLSNFIFDIEQTSYGHLILLTDKGIDLYDPGNSKNKYLDKDHGFPLEMINYGCDVYCTENGEIFAGGTNGLVSFFENQIESTHKDYNLFFSDLTINNQRISPDKQPEILSQAISYLKELKLRHNQNNFIIRFSASNYIKSNRHSYEYKLEGLDKFWYEAQDQSIKYTNLGPGRYILKVREKAGDHQEISPKEISLLIHIRPPFYATAFAFIIYSILLLYFGWKIYKFNNSRIELRTSLEYEKRENERIKEMNQSKLQFFTNISHEFRTPLTLIIGQIESLIQPDNLSAGIQNKLLSIYKNATQLRNLISELLDFRKQEHGIAGLKVSNNDLIPFIYEILQSFNEMANKRKINYQFVCVEKSIFLWFDPVQLQKVFYNLLSNAFKYTADKGSISVVVERKSAGIVVSVKDNGVGIPSEDMTRIFERFYQSKNQQNNESGIFSTGVGLSLSKGIVEMHHAEISVRNNDDGGSTFTVTLKAGDAHFSADEKKNVETFSDIISDDPGADKIFIQNTAAELNAAIGSAPSILIVEDNEDMLNFLTDIFHLIYKVETARDGIEALQKLRTIQPDIILSDVMMPNMTGKELCSKLKENFETSHIPVVLLTADSTEEQNIEGLIAGADDYITKPFSVKVLISRCNNLVINRRRLQEKYLKETPQNPVTIATNRNDQLFVEKATEIVKQHIADQEFSVISFATEMGLGKSKLYLKLKGITGVTPNDFILNVRLKTAAKLLRENHEMNISDITYSTGFSAPRYFSQCFKDLYGMPPLQYRKTMFGNDDIQKRD